MPKFRIKLRIRGYGYVTVKADNEDAAMELAETRANDDIENFVGDADDVAVEVAECEQIEP